MNKIQKLSINLTRNKNRLKKIKMALFKKKCAYCNEKIEKGKEILIEVKVPEFKNKVKRNFCNPEHAELYKKCITGTPSKSSCPYCKE